MPNPAYLELLAYAALTVMACVGGVVCVTSGFVMIDRILEQRK